MSFKIMKFFETSIKMPMHVVVCIEDLLTAYYLLTTLTQRIWELMTPEIIDKLGDRKMTAKCLIYSDTMLLGFIFDRCYWNNITNKFP